MGSSASSEERDADRASLRETLASARSQRGIKMEQKERAKAAKAGVNVDGALGVGHAFGENGAYETLVIWPDRVEKHIHKQAGSLSFRGKGLETIAIAKITSVQLSKKGVWAYIDIRSLGISIHYRSSEFLIPLFHDLITEQMRLVNSGASDDLPVAGGATPVTPAADNHWEGYPADEVGGASELPAPVSAIDQLRQLAELHQEGILTDEEFAEKKADLLRRI